jgi:hypothetical protein
MFDVLGDPSQQQVLIGLLILWAALLFGGFALGRPTDQSPRRMPVWTRMASSVVLVAAGWSWFLFSRDSEAGIYALLIAIGMTFGLLGDLAMAGLIRLGNRVIGGILAFGLGHVAYITAILHLGDRFGLNAEGVRLGAWLTWLLIGLIAWYTVVWRPAKKRSVMHAAPLGHALLLASTAGFATWLALHNGLFWGLALGAALFLLSDLILAGELFSGLRFPLIGDVVWLTYGPGQMLIVFSIDAALRLASG